MGSRAMCAISGGRTAPPSEIARPPNILWSTNRSELAELRRTRRWRSSGTPGGCTSIWPLGEVTEEGVAVVEGEPEVLAAPVGRGEGAPGQPVHEVSRTSGVPAHRSRMEDLHGTDPVAQHRGPEGLVGRPRPGKLRHCPTTPVRTRRRSPRRRSHRRAPRGDGHVARVAVRACELGADRAVRRLGRLLLGLLLRPPDAVAVGALGDSDPRGEGLQVVRALVLDEVLGHTEVVRGAELLQARLPVQPGAHRGGRLQHGVEEQVHQGGCALEAAGEVDGPDQRLDGVGEDRGLLSSAGGLLALAQEDVRPEVDGERDLGERPRVHHGSPQLGQPALGEVGMGQVERLGDDHAEHRVAEELQALVGRQVAVLVGVGPVREGKRQQLGIQRGITECVAQLAGVGRPCRCQSVARGQRT